MAKWKKLGRVFCPEARSVWMQSHAANPVAQRLEGDLYRIYFSTRDRDNRSSIATLDIDLTRPGEVLRLSTTACLSPGRVGTFDDSGVSMSCVVEHEGAHRLYYLGWNLGVTVPWRNSIGLAVERGGKFERMSLAPIVDRGHVDPFSVSYPWVMRDGNLWHMWYGSNLDWGREQKEMAHVLKYASSRDGIHWDRDGHVAIPFQSKEEYAISKPCVIRDGAVFKMWYSYRGSSYRIGYAESKDGKNWVRKDGEVGIGTSSEGWDSEAVSYPCVFDHCGRRFMLYNGNRYGLTGFGLAELVTP